MNILREKLLVVVLCHAMQQGRDGVQAVELFLQGWTYQLLNISATDCVNMLKSVRNLSIFTVCVSFFHLTPCPAECNL